PMRPSCAVVNVRRHLRWGRVGAATQQGNAGSGARNLQLAPRRRPIFDASPALVAQPELQSVARSPPVQVVPYLRTPFCGVAPTPPEPRPLVTFGVSNGVAPLQRLRRSKEGLAQSERLRRPHRVLLGDWRRLSAIHGRQDKPAATLAGDHRSGTLGIWTSVV